MNNTIQLQFVGRVPAQPAKNIKVGSKLMWNGGGVYEVTSVEFSKTGKTLNIKEKAVNPDKYYINTYGINKEWDRKLGADRLVAIL